MGYRSQVAALIYGPPDRVDALTMKWRHTDGFDLWSADAFGPHLDEWIAGEVKYIRLIGEDWKWYEGYTDVDAWTRFQSLAEEMGLSSEFVRVGEDETDIESTHCGDDCQHHLGVSTSIHFDVEPPETEERNAA